MLMLRIFFIGYVSVIQFYTTAALFLESRKYILIVF